MAAHATTAAADPTRIAGHLRRFSVAAVGGVLVVDERLWLRCGGDSGGEFIAIDFAALPCGLATVAGVFAPKVGAAMVMPTSVLRSLPGSLAARSLSLVANSPHRPNRAAGSLANALENT